VLQLYQQDMGGIYIMRIKGLAVLGKLNTSSIKHRLLVSFLVLLIIPSACIGYFSYNSAQKQLTDKISGSAMENVELLNQTIDQIIQMKIQDVQMLSNQISSNSADTYDMNVRKMINHFITNHPELELLVVGNNKGGWMKSPDPGKQDYDPRTIDWYKAAMGNPSEVLVTDPYVSSMTNNVVITIAKVIADGNGVISVDLNLAKIAEIVSEVKIGTEGYIYIIDRNSKFISHPRNAIGTDAKGTHYTEMLAKEQGILNYTLDGIDKQAYFMTNDLTGWKIVGTMEYREIAQATRPIMNSTLFVIAIALLLGMVMIYFIIRSISKPLQLLTEAAGRIGGGDLSSRIQMRSKDELGQLASSFNAMTDSLHTVLREVSDASNKLAASSEEMIASAEQTAKASEHITLSIQEVATGLESQAEGANETATAMVEMTVGIQKIAESANSIVDSSAETSRDVELGKERMREVTTQMVSIKQSVNGTANMIARLSELSNQINHMNTDISDMASQTNLLSLNAAIEAARAGEHGQGFAVVANEVRKLADHSKITANEIQTVIYQMADVMEAAKVEMGQKMLEAEQGINIVDKAEKAFLQMEKSTHSIVEQIVEVSAITEEMSASAQEISASVEDMANVAVTSSGNTQNVSAASEEQLASMEEISLAAESLSKMAEQLQMVVDRFKL
jgi:methyl-accepting chemotaxis protein